MHQEDLPREIIIVSKGKTYLEMERKNIQPNKQSILMVPSEPELFSLNPWRFGEIFLSNRDGSRRHYRYYQVEDLLSPSKKIVHLSGRKTGKTVNLSTIILWYTYVNRGKSVLVAAPYQGQLNTITEEVEYQLNQNKSLYNNLARDKSGRIKISRRPYFQLNFKTGCRVHFRPAGSMGNAFRSLHVDLLLVDEAAWIPEAAWKALRQCLNKNGIMRIYSTPSGLRDRTYYKITNDKEWKIFRWPSWISPDWDEQLHKDLLNFYGGENTSGWQHEIAGEHGMPSYCAFNISQVMRSLAEIPEYQMVKIDGESLTGLNSEQEVRERLEMLLNLPGKHGKFWLGADLGYVSDPTEILLFEESGDGILSLVLRIHAEKVAYPSISEIISIVDRVYSPTGLGIDRGGNGTAVEHELLNLDKFRSNHFPGRLTGYDFGSSIPVGEDEGGKPIKKPTKEVMSTIINKILNADKLRLPTQDTQIEDQLCTQTYTISDRGQIIYSKGNDHIIDAMRCALLRREMEVDSEQYESEVIVANCPIINTGPVFW